MRERFMSLPYGVRCSRSLGAGLKLSKRCAALAGTSLPRVAEDLGPPPDAVYAKLLSASFQRAEDLRLPINDCVTMEPGREARMTGNLASAGCRIPFDKTGVPPKLF